MTSEPVRTWESTEAAEGWRQGAARRARTLEVVTEQMLEAADLRSGHRVLDLAAGTGDQSVLAARRVGLPGSVLAVDISSSMLELARQAASEAGLDNIQTHVADASELDLPAESFDAAICRFGLMFVPDLHQALLRVHCALRPGARFAAVVWSTAERNPYFGEQISLVRDMGRMPSPAPTMVRTVVLSAPDTLERAFQAAGFANVQVSAVPAPRVFASVDEALGAMRSNSPTGDLWRDMSEAERTRFWTTLGERLRAYVQTDGRCVLPGEALLGVGTK